ncbi:MAG: hypothetical protein GY909_18205 [Oligoflexia bacterium]|nr:hypothetical protein [Oligoflexia bacterium]
MKALIFFLLCFSSYSYDVTVDVSQKGDLKIFNAKAVGIFDASVEKVTQGIINFDDKCNNQKRSKRKYMKWENNCPFHNENLVEAVKVQKYNSERVKNRYPHSVFLLWRNINNNGKYSHYDIVTKEKNNDELKIVHQMLNGSEVKEIVTSPERTVSAFKFLKGTYIIKPLAEKKTKVVYIYESKTDHWFLKRDFIEDKVKRNIVKGTTQALATIQESLNKGI